MKRSTAIFAALGVLFIVAAALVRFVVVPSASKLPEDTDASSQYSGKATLLNTAALQSGDVANAILRDQDVTMERRVYVSSANGDTAVVHDNATVEVAGQTMHDDHTYAIDRTTMVAADAPDGTEVEQHSGITVTLPLHPEDGDSYTLYDPAAATASPMTFQGTDSRDGRAVNFYESTTSGDLRNEELLKSMPPALPRELALQMLPMLPTETQQALASAGPIPDLIPLAYTSKTDYDVWVDQQLGAPLDVGIHRTVTAHADLAGQKIALLPVLDIDVKTTPEAVEASAEDAASAGRLLTAMSVWVPIGLVALALIAFALAARSHRRSV